MKSRGAERGGKNVRIIAALGGNALQANPKDCSAESQWKTCRETAKAIVDLIEVGHQIVIVHGNGPQVGQILSSMEAANRFNSLNIVFPFDVCDAFSQGYIGYYLQNALRQELRNRHIEKPVATVITQTVVDAEDPAFQNPSKPVGSFYTDQEAEYQINQWGYDMKEDAGRGYRRVVPSPKPLDIVEKDLIRRIVDSDMILIACGGGGIPVIYEGEQLRGVPAVIDKDFAAEKLAEILDADALLILTAVERVCIYYNQPNQQELSQVTLKEMEEYIEQGHFAPGSMLPKVEACKKFIEYNPNKIAIIAALSKAKEALQGNAGTRMLCESGG